LQWSTCLSRWKEEKEGGREKHIVGAPPRAACEHTLHHHSKGGEVH